MSGDETWKIVGFDIREEPQLSFVKHWPGKRREDHLGNPNVVQVVSTDNTVWPSLLPRWEDRDQKDKVNEAMGFQGMANDLDSLMRTERLAKVSDTWVISASVRQVDFDRIRNFWPSDLTKPSNPQGSWQSLGFDVVDSWLLSGLMNCGVGAAEFPPHLMPDLNEFHLFRTLTQADAFREFMDGIGGSHAPFMLAELWRVFPIPATMNTHSHH